MKDFKGKVAFITGGASGIGLGIATAFAGAGIKVAIADIRDEALNRAAAALARQKAEVCPIRLDVTDRKDWLRAADETMRAFGKVHILCNIAGVNVSGPLQQATYDDWDFCLEVNLGGVINGLQTLLPRIIAHGEGGHIVNMSSVMGLFTRPGSGIYAASKFAIVGLSESLRGDLAPEHIGVSVVCPGPVQSELFESTMLVRPKRLSRSGAAPLAVGSAREATPIFVTAMTAQEAGERILKGIQRNDLYVLTHPENRTMLEARCRALLAALPDEPLNQARAQASQSLLDAWLYEEQSSKAAP